MLTNPNNLDLSKLPEWMTDYLNANDIEVLSIDDDNNVNCVACLACEGCIGCKRCKECEGCKWCRECEGCKWCVECESCEWCKWCKWCQGLIYIYGAQSEKGAVSAYQKDNSKGE